MIETPFFFSSKEQSDLFGILHSPSDQTSTRGVVFVHPFAEEKLWAHRVFVSFARELASRNLWVLRFDLSGNGDSCGEFSSGTVSRYLSDIEAAIETLKVKTRVGGISLLGMRLGALLAAAACSERTDIERLLLWEPILDGQRYMQEVLRSNLATQMAVYGKVLETREQLVEKMKHGETVNIDGYEVSYEMFQDVSALRLPGFLQRFSGATFLAFIGGTGRRIAKSQESVAENRANLEVALVQEEPFWKEIKQFYGRAPSLFEATLRWLEERRE